MKVHGRVSPAESTENKVTQLPTYKTSRFLPTSTTGNKLAAAITTWNETGKSTPLQTRVDRLSAVREAEKAWVKSAPYAPTRTLRGLKTLYLKMVEAQRKDAPSPARAVTPLQSTVSFGPRHTSTPKERPQEQSQTDWILGKVGTAIELKALEQQIDQMPDENELFFDFSQRQKTRLLKQFNGPLADEEDMLRISYSDLKNRYLTSREKTIRNDINALAKDFQGFLYLKYGLSESPDHSIDTYLNATASHYALFNEMFNTPTLDAA